MSCVSPWLVDGGGDGEHALVGEGGLDCVRVHARGQREALAEALGGGAAAVRGLLLVARLHHHRVVHRPD